LDAWGRGCRKPYVPAKLFAKGGAGAEHKTAALNHLGRTDDAIATERQLINEFGDEAVATFDETIRQLALAPDPRAANSSRAPSRATTGSG
jgi:hypothetical protein